MRDGLMFQRVSPKTWLRRRPILHLGVFSVPLLPYLSMQWSSLSGRYNLWAWWGVCVYLVATPILEHLIGKDCASPKNDQIDSLEKNHYYELLVILMIPAQLFLLLYGAHVFSSTNAFNLFGQIGWILSNGMCSTTLAMIAGHELIHKTSRAEQIAGSFLLATVCNTGFKIDHIRGHHANFATPRDVYSARLHQSIYNFIPRAFYRNMVNPWKLENRRLNSKGHSIFSRRNQLINGYLLSFALAVIFYIIFGLLGLVYFVAQSAVTWIALQVINYIQHYGLIRHQLSPGKYEPPTPAHAWNSNFWLTNIMLLHLPRHPDHHNHPGRSFQVLRHIDESPQMPTGYAGMRGLSSMCRST